MGSSLPALTISHSWQELLSGPERSRLEGILPQYLSLQRWFGGKARSIQAADIVDVIPLPAESPEAYLSLVRVVYAEGNPETYRLPIAFVPNTRGQAGEETPGAIVQVVTSGSNRLEGVLQDAMRSDRFLRTLFGLVGGGGRFVGPFGEVWATPTRAFSEGHRAGGEALAPSVMKGEQSNTSVVYGNRYILKLYRRAEEGINPDLEIGRFLTERGFPNIARVASALEHRAQGREPSTVVLLQDFLPNKGDAWRYTLDSREAYLARASAHQTELEKAPVASTRLSESMTERVPPLARDVIGSYLDMAALLGRRTGELHMALGQGDEDPNFSPEPLSESLRADLVTSVESLIERYFSLLRDRFAALPAALHDRATQVLSLHTQVLTRVRAVRTRPLSCSLIRCHGDYHLGQVLFTGKDFIIIDFEGEPARPLRVRRMKACPLRDVAGMLRSYHYAAYAASMGRSSRTPGEPSAATDLALRFWYRWVAATYLHAYLDATGKAAFLPRSSDDFYALLELFLLEKAAYELGYELNNRPDWVRIPLEGILQLAAL